MTARSSGDDFAREAYDTFASVYDDYNRGQGYMNEQWTGRLLAAAESTGFSGDRLLDVGCGTGLSFIPMLERGWQVTACDISPAMLEIARAKVGAAAEIFVADLRELPDLGRFDLVWAINDPVNYLLSTDELEAALRGMHRNLAPEGILLFDLNTLLTYRTFFAGGKRVEWNGQRFAWHGQTSEDMEPGAIREVRFEAEGEQDLTHVHRQRHFTEAEVLAALEATGLCCREVLGVTEPEGMLSRGLDEEKHTKVVYVCSASR